jgi:hypothetical protein
MNKTLHNQVAFLLFAFWAGGRLLEQRVEIKIKGSARYGTIHRC